MVLWDFGITMEKAEAKNAFGLPLAIATINKAYHIDVKFPQSNTVQALQYIMHVNALARLDENSSIIQLQKNETYSTASLMHCKATQFRETLDDVIYPLQLRVTDNGNILGIANYDSIVQKWKHSEKCLQKKYNALSYVTNYNDLKTIIEDETLLLNTLQSQDWFINVFFPNFQAKNQMLPVNIRVYDYELPLSFSSKNIIRYHDCKKTPLILHRIGEALPKEQLKTISKTGSAQLRYKISQGEPIWDSVTGTLKTGTENDAISVNIKSQRINTHSATLQVEHRTTKAKYKVAKQAVILRKV